MKKLFLVAIVLSIGFALSGSTDAQKPVPAGKKTYARGRKVDPQKVAEQRRLSVLLHGHKLKALPQAKAAQFDCRSLGWVGPIQDQGQCGSCWDFSGTDFCTSAFYKAGVLKNDGAAASYLSQQYTLDCGQNGGCNGDDNITVADWCKKTGLPTQADYGPYTASSGNCRATSSMKLYRIQDWGFCTTSNQQGVAATQDIKNAMVQYGPIGSGIDANVLGDGTGIVSGTGHNIDHDIVLVGWDDTKGKGGCWILRNSWGTSWGVQGYCYIEYGAGDVGTEACWAVAAGSPPPPPGAPVITSAQAAVGQPGAPFSYQIVATNAPTAYDATGLPAGLTVDATSGLISGTPLAAGVAPVALSAANAGGVGRATLVITIGTGPTPPPPPGAVTITLTTDQVSSVLQQSGQITVSPNMTLKEFADVLEKLRLRQGKQRTPTTKEPPLRGAGW